MFFHTVILTVIKIIASSLRPSRSYFFERLQGDRAVESLRPQPDVHSVGFNIIVGMHWRDHKNVNTRLCCLLMALLVSACTDQPVTQSGFLKNYDQLSSVSGEEKTNLFMSEKFNRESYACFTVMPVRVLLNESSPHDEKAERELANVLKKSLVDEFKKYMKYTPDQSRQCVSIKSAITGVTTINPVTNVIATIIANPIQNGGLSIESEILDASSSERLAAISWADEGSVFSIEQTFATYQTYGHAEFLAEKFPSVFANLLGYQAQK